MHGEHEFLRTLALVLSVAAVTTVLFHRLKQPVVLGYLLAGLIVGPSVPIPLVADRQTVQTLSEVGVILLMFSLGLEFSLKKLFRVGPKATLIAVLQVSLMLWLGYVTGQLFGWTRIESLFVGAIISISSTTIIAKAYEEQKHVERRLHELVFGVLIVEDLVAILLLATLASVSTGETVTVRSLALLIGRLGGFLAALLAVGLLVIPRLMRFVMRLERPETTLVASIGFCFATSLLALSLGYSVALGAFLAGSLIAESGQEKAVEHLVQPVRDMFAAIFFVSVGMLIDPRMVLMHWQAVAVLTALVVVATILGVTLGAFLTGSGVSIAVQAGMSLANIGEFSFIIAGLGLALGATRSFLYPVAVAVSALTTLFTPLLIRASVPAANFIDRKLPRPLQTFVSLYASWLERLRSAPMQPTTGSRVRRLGALMLLDTALLAALTITAFLLTPSLARALAASFGFGAAIARALPLVAAALIALPLCVGLARLSRALALTLAAHALPPAATGRLDLADAPRSALVGLLQATGLLFVGVLLVAVTQPFLRPFEGALVVVTVLLALTWGSWRSVNELQGHVRAGSQAIAEVLMRGARGKGEDQDGSSAASLDAITQLFPGLGDPTTMVLGADSPAAGKTLGELNVRGRCGGAILAIRRGGDAIVGPTGKDRLLAGDILAVAGSHEAVAEVRTLLGARLSGPADCAVRQA
ncbi:MAG: cation:proton antiporter [Thermoanaerobaculia bacterium]